LGAFEPICTYLRVFQKKKDCLFFLEGIAGLGRQINPKAGQKQADAERKMKSPVDLGAASGCLKLLKPT
jgi:hypothetical protein